MVVANENWENIKYVENTIVFINYFYTSAVQVITTVISLVALILLYKVWFWLLIKHINFSTSVYFSLYLQHVISMILSKSRISEKVVISFYKHNNLTCVLK